MQDLIPASTKTNLSMKNTRTEKGKRGRKEKNKFLVKKRRKEREKLRYVFMSLHFSKKKVLTFSRFHIERSADMTVTCILKLEYIQTGCVRRSCLIVEGYTADSCHIFKKTSSVLHCIVWLNYFSVQQMEIVHKEYRIFKHKLLVCF